jgi:hypothetical protein
VLAVFVVYDISSSPYESLLCAWFITCIGRSSANIPDPLVRPPGDTMPTVPKAVQQAGSDNPHFEIPREYCCHISNEIMEDPVLTVDNYTYERRNIEQWLQSNERSPLTNLVLVNNDLRPNVQLKEAVEAYFSCSDILSRPQTVANPKLMHVTFRSPLLTQSFNLPQDLKLRDLWEIAFRLTKGCYLDDYELQHQDARVPTSQDITVRDVIHVNHEIFVTPLHATATTSPNANQATEELCLVKVYGRSYSKPEVSYWETMSTTKVSGSTVFGYYRQRFTLNPSTTVEEPFIFWLKLRHAGNNHKVVEHVKKHWASISRYFNAEYATGSLSTSHVLTKLEMAII